MIRDAITGAIGLALAAAVAFGWLAHMDARAKARKIEALQIEVVGVMAELMAARVHAAKTQAAEVEYRTIIREVESHGPLSEACRNDPRLGAAYDGIERMRDAAGIRASE